MKIAYFVMGPESSGTRMMTQAFISVGAYGDGGHWQKLDKGFIGAPDKIVFRRSLPHGKNWTQIHKFINRMKQAEYQIINPILIVRDKEVTAKSQIKNKHVKTIEQGYENITKAIDHVYRELALVGMTPTVIHYEPFVNRPGVRRHFFRSLGLENPKMDFYNANDKY
jgi:hypothetical protein